LSTHNKHNYDDDDDDDNDDDDEKLHCLRLMLINAIKYAE